MAPSHAKTPTISKSRNHRIEMNSSLAPVGGKKLPYKLIWEVKRQGSQAGFPVKMNRPSDRDGAEEFARRWGVKMPEAAK